ncbi:MAG: tetratricopeptide repeat protein, partial [Gammaproteobacteria bacterium]
IYYAQNKLDHAVNCYHRAIAKEPDYIDAYYNLGLALNKKKDITGAIDIYEKLLLKAPDHFAARFHLGCTLMQANKIDAAIKTFSEIEARHPNHFETQSNLATCLLKSGRLNEAKLHYFKALEIEPQDTQILFNLGVISMQQGLTDIAIQHYQRANQINPNDFATHNNLGVAFLAKQHPGFAIQHFQEALRLQPNNKAVQHTLKILSEHQHLLASPPEYIKALFDSYADHYEAHLLSALDYQVPNLLFSAIQEVAKPQPNSWDILDLGCGTGLCGVVFQPIAKTLSGVDLSPKMLEIAAQKNIYSELAEKDLIAFLSDKRSAYDLVIAGDVLVYLGDLHDIFREANLALRNKGYFLFNTEIREDADFKMNQSGRFAHAKKYLEKLAQEYHFKIAYYQAKVTRLQNNEPVYGHLLVLQKIG